MSSALGKLWTFRARGRFAHFGGIPIGPERATMLFPSHSACVGILRSLFGKFEARWCVESATMLSIPKTEVMVFRQFKDFFSPDGADGVPEPIDLDGHEARFDGDGSRHTLRHWTFLVDPDFVIRARISLAPSAGADDSIAKFDEMIARRARQGYRRYQPYFGIRECTAHVFLVESEVDLPAPVDLTQDFGLSFYDIDIDDPEKPAYLAPASAKRGVVCYPTFAEVRKLGLRYKLERVYQPGRPGAEAEVQP